LATTVPQGEKHQNAEEFWYNCRKWGGKVRVGRSNRMGHLQSIWNHSAIMKAERPFSMEGRARGVPASKIFQIKLRKW